jgi:hypothetical protein
MFSHLDEKNVRFMECPIHLLKADCGTYNKEVTPFSSTFKLTMNNAQPSESYNA